MPNDLHFPALNRRAVAVGLVAGGAVLASPGLSFAQGGADAARAAVEQAVAAVNRIIASGQSEREMYDDFERVFAQYADVPTIARSTLGVAARQATAAQLQAYTQAYQGYVARKYGRRFREFVGGKIEVTGVNPIKSYYEVRSVAYTRGNSPADVRWHVSTSGSSPRFFNIIIQGVNMLASERTEVQAILDQQGGSIDRLTQALRNA
ncbi:phospholipid-binding protein MlaC [Falsirhodobacter algicola]|uniref:ABC transporter substrate-binding protein n=1 Tax=Falsirhodobacter algicola TaxID=2692330 RepID=A0A8J8SL01_9RHOB|nr:ABC transporter substrate-binding protein [Falsirhodobacter algicola]QUS35953.1 ABC transporter substrate-binding protein [Falsirhodobacter algicola]